MSTSNVVDLCQVLHRKSVNKIWTLALGNFGLKQFELGWGWGETTKFRKVKEGSR